MDDTQRITELATRAKIAGQNGDEVERARLWAEAVRISDLATLRRAGIEEPSDA